METSSQASSDKQRETQIPNIRNEKWAMITDPMSIKRIIKKYLIVNIFPDEFLWIYSES